MTAEEKKAAITEESEKFRLAVERISLECSDNPLKLSMCLLTAFTVMKSNLLTIISQVDTRKFSEGGVIAHINDGSPEYVLNKRYHDQLVKDAFKCKN